MSAVVVITWLLSDIFIFFTAEAPDDKDSGTAEEMNYSTCGLISSINYNGLFYFLFANLLTGLVNMSVKTIYQSNFIAMVILTVYMFVMSAVSYFLYKRKILLKIWWHIKGAHLFFIRVALIPYIMNVIFPPVTVTGHPVCFMPQI